MQVPNLSSWVLKENHNSLEHCGLNVSFWGGWYGGKKPWKEISWAWVEAYKSEASASKKLRTEGRSAETGRKISRKLEADT